jgi:histidinol-phosphate aminotransferase
MTPGFDRDRLVPEYVRGFEAYRPSQPDAELCRLYGVTQLHRLHNNENPLGPPEVARAVLAGFAPPMAAVYPSGDCWYLRHALARRWDVDPDQVVVGNGVNEVIAFVIKAFCQSGDNIVTADRTFSVAEWIAAFSGLEARLIPLCEDRFDAEAMLAAIDGRTKVVFVCNPNNPTGTYWTAAEMDAFLERVDGRAVVVIDEAYAEYMDVPDYPDSRSLLARHPNLVVFRTFSKAYGLAGLRVGYLIGAPEPADAIRRTQVVYSVNTIAQAAALAALETGEAHLVRSRELTHLGRAVAVERLAALDLPVVSHHGNFLMTRLPISDTLAYRRMMGLGFVIRPMTAFRFPGWIRVTVAEPAIMNGFADALAKALRRS